MKIKTFEFQITDFIGTCYDENKTSIKRIEENDLMSCSDIDAIVNTEIANSEKDGLQAIDIKVDLYTKKRHNNGCCDTVMERVTIIFKEVNKYD